MQLLQKFHKISSLYLATFLFLATFIAYANTLGNGLFFDDEDFIYNNVYVQHFQLTKFFTQNTIAGASKISNYYRPLLSVWYSLEWEVVGKNGFLYHLDSLFIHAAAGIALFVLLSKLFKNKFVAFFTSLLFLIHPVQTEAVAYASGRSDPMMAFLLFVTIILFLRGSVRSKFISYFTLILALLSRETAIIIPVIIVLVRWYQLRSLKKVWEEKTTFLPYFLIAGVYFFLRLTALNFQDTLNFYGSSQGIYAGSLLNRLFTFFAILPQYLGILFFPKILFIDRIANVMTSLLRPLVIIPIFFVLGFLGISLKYVKQYPILLFSFLWFFITLSPTSGILPINGIIYEHFLYLPSIAVFLLIAYGLWQIVIKIKSKPTSLVLFLILNSLLLILMFRTIVRNNDWHDPVTFYNQTIQNNPNSARLYNNLAMAYADQNQTQKAIANYKKAIMLSDTYPQTHFNLANAYAALGNIKEAQKEYEKTLAIDPGFIQAYVSFAQIYKQTGEKEKLQNLLEKFQMLAQKNPQLSPLLQQLKSL